MIELLIVIALIEARRLWLVERKMTHKRHFKLKSEATGKMIWDMEFKVFKSLQVREEIRQEYDMMNSRIEAMTKGLKGFKGKKAEKASAEDQLALAKRDLARFESQMKQIDIEINGSKPTADLPDGHQGTVTDIDILRELRGQVDSYVKSL